MKRLIILLACAGLIAGCAGNREKGQGGAGYNDTGSSTGTSTNGTNSTGTSPNQGGTAIPPGSGPSGAPGGAP